MTGVYGFQGQQVFDFTPCEQEFVNEKEEEFFKFHEENPGVYKLFNRFCYEYLDSGKEKISAAMIINRIRWEIDIHTTGDDLKINNNHQPYYARLWVRNNPAHKNLFNFKKVRGEEDGQEVI